MTNEQREKRRLERCKHFTGIQNQVCQLGIKYASVRFENMFPQTGGRAVQYPCIDPGCDRCDKREYQTPEESEAEEKMFAERTAMMIAALNAISQHAGKFTKGEGSRGVIECPTCKGKLHYSRAGYNGHVHAKCETADCVAFMQ
jgi:hypothetical protein